MNTKSIMRASSLLLMGNALALVLGLAYIILIPNMMGVETYGKYSFLFSYLFLFKIISEFGLIPSLTYYLSKFRKKKQKAKIKGLFYDFLKIKLLTSLLLVVFFLILTISLHPEYWFHFILISISFVFSSLASYFFIVMYVYKKLGRYALNDVITKFGRVALVPFFFIIFGLIGAIIGLLITDTIVLILSIIFAYRRLPRKSEGTYKKRNWYYLSFGLPFFFSNVLKTLMHRISVILLGFLDSFTAVGFFNLAAEILYLTLPAFISHIPRSVRPDTIMINDQKTRLTRLFNLTLKYTLSLSLVFMLVFFLFSENIILFLFGESFQGAAIYFKIFSVTMVFRLILLVFDNLIYSAKKPLYGLLTRILMFASFLIMIIIMPLTPFNLSIIFLIASIVGGIFSVVIGTKLNKLKINKKLLLKLFFDLIITFGVYYIILVRITNWLLNSVIVISTYLLLMCLMKVYTRKDLNRLLSIFR